MTRKSDVTMQAFPHIKKPLAVRICDREMPAQASEITNKKNLA